MDKIILYSSHCPKCVVLEQKLKQKNIQYEICDDIDLMVQKGMKSAPALEVGDEFMDFTEAIKWIKEQ